MLAAVNESCAGWADQPSTARIANVVIAPRDAKTATVTFDVSWADSWRHEANHDAVWVFFKVRAEGGKEWQPVRLVADKVLNPSGYAQAKGGTPVDVIVPDGEDGFLGMFVRRRDYGFGTVMAEKVTAVWDFTASQGITKDLKASIRAHVIEMVFVPEGAYYLGSGGSEPFHFHAYTDGAQHTLPYRVTGAGAIPTGRQAGKLWARRGAQPVDGGEIPAAFPNGYAAFYCMKKHINADEYTGFLNSLPPAQAEARHGGGSNSIRRSGTPPDVAYSVDAESGCRHANGLSWADGVAFAAWAGLRPMTELEYEKITRGPMSLGWATADELDLPSYWEVTNINGWRTPRERTVTVANAAGRRFQGSHGRGTPTLPSDWPQDDAVGTGIRGGHGQAGRPSNRLDAATAIAERQTWGCWRGVRSAPKGVGL